MTRGTDLLSLAETLYPEILEFPEIVNEQQAFIYQNALSKASLALEWFDRNRTSEPTNLKDLMTPSEVAAAFGVDAKTVTRWAKTAQIDAIRTLGGHRRYSRAQVEDLSAFRRGED